MHPLLRLARDYGWQRRWSYLAGVLALLATNGIAVRIPVEIGQTIDALRQDGPVGPHAAVIVLMGLCVMGVRTLSRVLFFNPGRDVEYALRRDLFAHLLRLQPAFYAGQKRGDIISRASNDITWARLAMGFGLLAAVNVSTAFLLTGGQMLVLSPRLTLFVVAPLALALVVVRLCILALLEAQRELQAETGRLSDQVLGTLQGIATVQGFRAEEAFIARFEARNEALYRLGMKLAWLRSVAFPLLILGSGVAVALLLWIGGPMALAGELSVGELAAFVALLATLAGPLRSLGWLLSIVQQGRAGLERIFELLDAPVERPEGPTPAAMPGPGRGPGFELRDLTWAYPDDPARPVLRDLDLAVPPGAVIGVFGRTGSGKSTLIRLLARVYNPPPGTVTVVGADGARADLVALDLDAWRARISAVPQRAFLFSESLAANVALVEAPDPERLRAAVSAAALDTDLAALPQGLDTVVGERGIMLSGGQRQRAALARGLYRDADLVLLDDVLSAVDHQTEARLVETLTRLARGPRGPTVFIVSHRLSALRHADRILVLDQGRLVDQGDHKSLLARPGLYRDTWEQQRDPGASPAGGGAP